MHSPNPAEKDLLANGSPFHFSCHDALPCFTQCCKDVNIYLTPYDVLQLRKAMNLGSAEFLAKYTQHFLARVTSIPVVQLLMDPQTLYCPFVSEAGCRVYENRPWACRMFPLDLSPLDGKYHLIAGKERCMGLFERGNRTVEEWLRNQGIGPYTQMEQEYQAVVPERFQPGEAMNEGLGRVLFLAYDLDRFAELLKNGSFLKLYDVDKEMLRKVQEDGAEMLRLAFRYIRTQMNELYQVL